MGWSAPSVPHIIWRVSATEFARHVERVSVELVGPIERYGGDLLGGFAKNRFEGQFYRSKGKAQNAVKPPSITKQSAVW